jgi:REP element-mobilizing transposase RayT
MSRTFTNLLTHVIFSTKDREPTITNEARLQLFAYLGGLTRELKGKAYGINGTNDHVHMLISLPPNVSTSDALRFIKANSSGWMRKKMEDSIRLATRLWCFQRQQIKRSGCIEIPRQPGSTSPARHLQGRVCRFSPKAPDRLR